MNAHARSALRQTPCTALLALVWATTLGVESAQAQENVERQAHALIGGEPCSTDHPSAEVSVAIVHQLRIANVTKEIVTIACGGTKLGPHAVLTAAHCVPHIDESSEIESFSLTVIEGPTDAPSSEQHQVRVQTWSVPAEYDPEAFSTAGSGLLDLSDIALLFVDTDLEPPFAKLPSVEGEPALGEPVQLVGFGLMDENGEGFPGNAPQCATTTVREVGASEFVAGDDNVKQCSRDSGGGVFRLEDDIPTIIGIASHKYEGSSCALPGVSTKVVHFLPWLKQELAAYTPPTRASLTGGACHLRAGSTQTPGLLLLWVYWAALVRRTRPRASVLSATGRHK